MTLNNKLVKENNIYNILLDSRLITRVRFEKYDFKIVKCGEYLQVYYYPKSKVKDNAKNLDINNLKIKSFNKKETNKNLDVKIEDRNIIRTKLNCQRLAKANARHWNSFITLTYESNMQDMEQAKKDLNFFIKNIKKVKRDFRYIAIPEFQKRGAIHFHLLTNLNIQDNNIIIKQKSNEKFYDVKYWNKGFTSFEPLDNDLKKVIGYISKYMTKDIDNRLFGIRRFTCSQNLVKPIEEYININLQRDKKYLLNLMKGNECIYTNTYQDNKGNEVMFKEFKL